MHADTCNRTAFVGATGGTIDCSVVGIRQGVCLRWRSAGYQTWTGVSAGELGSRLGWPAACCHPASDSAGQCSRRASPKLLSSFRLTSSSLCQKEQAPWNNRKLQTRDAGACKRAGMHHLAHLRPGQHDMRGIEDSWLSLSFRTCSAAQCSSPASTALRHFGCARG